MLRIVKKLGLPVVLGTALAMLAPATTYARDRDDRYERHERHERREYREHRRFRGGYYYGPSSGYSNGYYDRWGYWHPYAQGYYDRWGNWHAYGY